MPLNDLPGYYPTILEGGLGIMPPSYAGLVGFVGNAYKGTTDLKFASIADPDAVVREYGAGTGVEKILDAFATGATQIGIKRPVADLDGVISAVTHKEYGGTGEGGVADVDTGYIGGNTSPHNDRSFRIKITAAGAFSTARYKISENGGITWSAEKKFKVTTVGPPQKSKIDLGNGTYIEFTEDTVPADSFVTGDQYRWTTTEAKSSLDRVLAEAEALAEWVAPNGIQGFRRIYISNLCGETTEEIEAFWAALCTIAEDIWDAHKRGVYFIVEAPKMADDGTETIDDWLATLETLSAEYRHVRLAVSAGFGLLTDKAGRSQVRNFGGSVCGLLSSRRKLHHNIGWVQEMMIPNCTAVYPFHPISNVEDEALGVGNGTNKDFTGTLENHPIDPWSLTVTSTDTTPEIFTDNGDGTLTGSLTGTGTIDYATGAYSVSFHTAPASTKIVSANYTFITQDAMNEGNLARLEDARYLSLRNWGAWGRIPTYDHLFSPDVSDYFCIRYRELIDEVVDLVHLQNMPYVNSPGITIDDYAGYKADLERPIAAMTVGDRKNDEPILAFGFTIWPDENIWSNETSHARVEIVPNPSKKRLEIDFTLTTKVKKEE